MYYCLTIFTSLQLSIHDFRKSLPLCILQRSQFSADFSNGWKQFISTEWNLIIFAAINADCHLKIYRVEKSSAVVEQIIEVGTVDCRYCMLTIPGLHLGCSPLKSRSRKFLKPLILAKAPWHLLRLQDWLYRLIKASHVMIDYEY